MFAVALQSEEATIMGLKKLKERPRPNKKV
jgi:hypothetical protein